MRDVPADAMQEIPAASTSLVGRLATQARRRLDRLTTRLAHARGPHPLSQTASPLPMSTISGRRPRFDELERLTFDAALMARVEPPSPVPLVRPDHEPIDAARLAASLGWSRRAQPARLYDITPFAFEVDMLELRLVECDGLVDRFIVGESPRGFGGMHKPLYLQRNWLRFTPFHGRMEHVVIRTEGLDEHSAERRRERTDWIGEDALRTQLWHQVRAVAREPDTVIIWADVDELLPRWCLHLLKYYACPTPLRIQAPAFRYHFGWRDPEATAGITVFDARSVDQIDPMPARIRSTPARTFSARGAVHLTSFLDPAVLQMKFAVTTDWEPGIERYIRSAHGETAAMVQSGHWFGRTLRPYDADRDPMGLVPLTARLNRARYRWFWPAVEPGAVGPHA